MIQFTVTMGDDVETFIFKDTPFRGVGKKVSHLCDLVKAFSCLKEGTLTEKTTVNEERKLLRELKDLGVKTEYSVMYLIDKYIYKHNLPMVICSKFYEVDIKTI